MSSIFCLIGLHNWYTEDKRAARFRDHSSRVVTISGIATLQKCLSCDKKRAWVEDSFGKVTILSAAVHEENIKKVDGKEKTKWRNVNE